MKLGLCHRYQAKSTWTTRLLVLLFLRSVTLKHTDISCMPVVRSALPSNTSSNSPWHYVVMAGNVEAIKLRGGRFDSGGFPLNALKELSRYQKIVLEVAKHLWREENSDRKNLPAGFERDHELRLMGLEDGCVVAVLDKVTPAGVLLPNPDDLVSDAGYLVADTVDSVARGVEIPSEFPLTIFPRLAKFGTRLADDETVVLKLENGTSVDLDTVVRQKFQEIIDQMAFVSQAQIVGQVTELDAEKHHSTFRTPNKSLIQGYFESVELLEDFLAALNELANAPVVRLACSLEDGKATGEAKILDVSSLELLVPGDHPYRSRLVELLALGDGWLDGEGDTIDVDVLEAAAQISTDILGIKILGKPEIYPMLSGGIQLEWDHHNLMYGIEITPDRESKQAFTIACSLHNFDDDDYVESEYTSLSEALKYLSEGSHGQ